MRRFQSLSALAILLFITTTASASDWPQYMGPNRDGVWPEIGIVEKFPEGGPKVRWRVPIKAGYTGPSVVGGKVFVMDRELAEGAKNHDEKLFPHRPGSGIPGKERVLCFSTSDGKQLWKHEYDCAYTVSYPDGPRCTPTVHDGLVYALGTEGNLHCLKADTGKVVWQKDFAKDYGAKSPIWGHSAHPLIDGKKLFCVVGGEGSVVVAFDKDNGKELWKALTAKEQGYCMPMIYEINGRRQLIIWHAESINGLDPENGNVYWTVETKMYMGMAISAPRVSGNQLFVTAFGGQGGNMYSGGLLRPEPDGNTTTVWKSERKKLGFESVFSTPQIDGDYIYGVDNPGTLTCVKAETGERLWQSLDAHGGKKEGSAELFLVKNGDRWFIANEKGDLIIAKLSPSGYEEISRAHLLEPDSTAFGRKVVWSHPAFAEKCAFMRNNQELICVELGK
jgi:outer membrane protein assembly factor BamB